MSSCNLFRSPDLFHEANLPSKINLALVTRAELRFTAKASVFPKPFRHSTHFLVREAEQPSRNGVWLFSRPSWVSPIQEN